MRRERALLALACGFALAASAAAQRIPYAHRDDYRAYIDKFTWGSNATKGLWPAACSPTGSAGEIAVGPAHPLKPPQRRAVARRAAVN